jgi:hypothetical protein
MKTEWFITKGACKHTKTKIQRRDPFERTAGLPFVLFSVWYEMQLWKKNLTILTVYIIS